MSHLKLVKRQANAMIQFPFSFLANTNEIIYYIIWPLRRWTIQPLSIFLIDVATACLFTGQLIVFYQWRKSYDMRCAAGLVTSLCGLHIVMILLNSSLDLRIEKASFRGAGDGFENPGGLVPILSAYCVIFRICS
ncbi:Phenylacetate 2-hydroxylase [Venturia nashicola]|uniref:Phenylacetate 2-hydroxylase n=1 Tax=Venturia nashicola TaxID=86259 RepID=A0A4Z1PI76_9PEZI|nr:Phenylacetate 2-hydroxylase [Venturia nashicola]